MAEFSRRLLITALANGVGLAMFLGGVWWMPRAVCSRGVAGWWQGDVATWKPLARGVERCLDRDLARGTFGTGSPLFEGEWLFGTYLMAGLGFGQTALSHPEFKERHARLMRSCIERILSEPVKAFDREEWGHDPITDLGGPRHHAAYLGYLNLLLGLHREIDPESPFRELHDGITAHLASRMEASPTLLLETYPLEVYPVDNCAAAGSVFLHARVAQSDHAELQKRWCATLRQRYRDKSTGLLVQAVHRQTGQPADEGRGSGTALGAYLLGFAEPALAGELYASARQILFQRIAGFGAVREYQAGREGSGDIDSGPLLFGWSVSATGFLLGSTRAQGDIEASRCIYRSVRLCGAPLERDGRAEFVSGGPLGDAILFAMLTAGPMRDGTPKAAEGGDP